MPNKTICPKCQRPLRNINAWHYCEQVDIDDLFVGKSDDVILVFDRILAKVAMWDDIDISGTKNCVVFVKNKTFLVLKPMRKWLDAKCYLPDKVHDPLFHKLELWNSKYQAIFRLNNETEFTDKHLHYMRQSYDMS